MNAGALVLAKAPVAGQVKTRLGRDIGHEAAAEVAAAALLDTVRACSDAFGPAGCVLSLSGDLVGAVRGGEILRAIDGWRVEPQRGAGFGERLVNAHLDGPGGGATVQVGMDTPQVTPRQLRGVADRLATHDAVLGPAEDGGWWVLGLRDPRAAVALRGVEMSTPRTYDDTLGALREVGLDVGIGETLRDIDDVDDAHAVATGLASELGGSDFARTWRRVAR